MATISIMDGLVLTIVSMLVVFIVLVAIWGLVELISKSINESEPVVDTVDASFTNKQATTSTLKAPNNLAPNVKHQQVAELMALVLASEDEPNKKFEIVESKRVK